MGRIEAKQNKNTLIQTNKIFWPWIIGLVIIIILKKQEDQLLDALSFVYSKLCLQATKCRIGQLSPWFDQCRQPNQLIQQGDTARTRNSDKIKRRTARSPLCLMPCRCCLGEWLRFKGFQYLKFPKSLLIGALWMLWTNRTAWVCLLINCQIP